MVAERRLLSGLSAQLRRQQQRWPRRFERHHIEAGLSEETGRGCDLDFALLPFAAKGFWLRRFRLRKYRSHVRDAGGLRPAGPGSEEARDSHHPGFRSESYFRPAQMVPGFQVITHGGAPRLVHLARRIRTATATEQLGFGFWGLGLDVRPYDKPVLLPLF